jgi:hypothetical protein
MGDAATRLRKAAVECTVRGPGKSSTELRAAAFDNARLPAAAAALVDKIAHAAWTISDADVAAARAAGLSEDEIFEITACAAYGQAARQLDAGLAALAAATAPTKTGGSA